LLRKYASWVSWQKKTLEVANMAFWLKKRFMIDDLRFVIFINPNSQIINSIASSFTFEIMTTLHLRIKENALSRFMMLHKQIEPSEIELISENEKTVNIRSELGKDL
jgi:hypothetical protein